MSLVTESLTVAFFLFFVYVWCVFVCGDCTCVCLYSKDRGGRQLSCHFAPYAPDIESLTELRVVCLPATPAVVLPVFFTTLVFVVWSSLAFYVGA